MRRTVVVPVLVALVALTACGAGPSDAAPGDFCAAESEFEESGSTDALAETGTPADIPTEARQGFELQVDLSVDEVDGLTDAQLDLLAQFGDYVDRTCG